MNCEQVKEHLSTYLDDTLAQEERRQVATHLQVCPECREILADFRHFDTLIRQLPRISPDISLSERIFSSPEYFANTFDAMGRANKRTVLSASSRRDEQDRPRLIALPGGRHPLSPSISPSQISSSTPAHSQIPQHKPWRQRVIRGMIAATLLFTIGMGSFIGWQFWQKQGNAVADTPGVTPPTGLASAPLPVGPRFVFLRDGALWSAPTDNRTGIVRLTSDNVKVADNWAVRTPSQGSPTRNLIAYIDLQQGYIHIIRSDGQSDTVIPQPLLKRGSTPSSIWETGTGAAILGSLNWSQDGNMLAFVADPEGTEQPGLYLYSPRTNKVLRVALPFTGAVSQPVWSPDGVRVAFKLSYDGNTGILDYNTKKNGVLTIAPAVDTAANPHDTVLSLDWSPDTTAPTITWSVGVAGQVHSIWTKRVGVGSTTTPLQLASGDYVEASYSRAGNGGNGSWLLIASQAGQRGDIINLDLTTANSKLTDGKQVSSARWSPNGTSIDYFDGLSDGRGTLHIIRAATGYDRQVATNVVSIPAPAWSQDGQRLAYSTGSRVHVANIASESSPLNASPLKVQGSVTALSWSVASSHQLMLAMSTGQQGIYLADTKNGSLIQLDKESTNGPIWWTQIS